MITELIDKQDTSEIIRDKIGAILAVEVANQMALAVIAAKPPEDWKLRIFTERSNPWEQWLNDDVDRSPIVNVWYESTTFNEGLGNVVERQAGDGIFNIDCYGYGKSADIPEGGHTPGDREAAFEAQRAIRLVRNILMAATYTYLDLRGAVWQRWPQAITIFQPQQEGRAVQQVVGARLALRVRYNELSPQVFGEILEKIALTVKRGDGGEIIYFTAEYDH